jgi:hypothetical protein
MPDDEKFFFKSVAGPLLSRTMTPSLNQSRMG